MTKIIFLIAMLVAASVMACAAYKLGKAQPRPIPALYMIYNIESGDVEQTRDEQVVQRCLRNRHLRVFTFTPAQQFDEISFGRIHHQR